MAPPPRFVVADGRIESKSAALAGIDTSKYVFQFSSRLVLCDVNEEAGSFENNVRCRKWTDLSGNTFNTPCHIDPPTPVPPQPDPGCIVNVGDITLKIKPPQPRTIKCPNFKLEGTQTHRTKVLLSSFVVFLFTGEGESTNGEIVRGVGSCLETLVPDGPPKVDSWNFVFTIC